MLLCKGLPRKAGGPVNKRTHATDVRGHSPVPPPPAPPLSTKPTAAEPGPAVRKQAPAVIAPSNHRPHDDEDGLPPPPSATNVPVIRVNPSLHLPPPPPPPSSNKPGGQRVSHERRPSDSGLVPPSSAQTARRPSWDNLVTPPAGVGGASPTRTGMPPPPPPPNRHKHPSDSSLNTSLPNARPPPPPPPPRKTPTLTSSGTGTAGRPSKTAALGQVNGGSDSTVPLPPRLPPSRPSTTSSNCIDSNNGNCFSG